MVEPDAEPAHAGEAAREKAIDAMARPKPRARTTAARARTAKPDAPRAMSVKAPDGDLAGNEPETESEEETEPVRPRAGRIAVKLARNLLIILWHLSRALASMLKGVMVRYPRHSLAAVASVLILGWIEYVQWKGAKTPPVNQISAKQPASSPAGKEPAGSDTAKIAATGAKTTLPDKSQAGPALPQSEKPELATPVASVPPTPTATPEGSSVSAASAAASEPPLPLGSPNGQSGLVEGDKTAPAKTESAVVSAPGLLVAASETLPPPASSLGKDGATLLVSSAESAPPAPPPVGDKEPAGKEPAKNAPPAAAPPAPAPAPAPSAAKSDKVPEEGSAIRPAPTPALKQPEPELLPAPGPLSLDSVPTPAPKPADSAPVPAPANPPAVSGQRADGPPPPSIEAAPPVTSPAPTESVPGSSPAPQHEKGLPEIGHDASKDAGTSQSKPGSDTANPKPEPPPDPGPAPVAEAKAKPGSNDKPEPSPGLVSPPLGDGPSETKTASAPAASSSGPQDARKGEVQLVPKLNHEPEPSPALSQTGEEPVKPETKPAQTPAPLANPRSAEPADTAAKHETESARSDDPAGSAKHRAESHPDAIAPAATETAPPGWVPIHNSGKVPLAAGDELDPPSSDSGDAIAGSDSIRDSQPHAAKDMTFEMESPRPRAVAVDPGTDSTQHTTGQSGSAAGGARRVETVPHVVENRENFWTISRQYYGSGRYYRALWKANADRCPQIDGLRVNDVIIIPPPEDLDPNYIDPPGEPARSVRKGRATKPSDLPPARERRQGGMADPSESAADSSSPLATESPSFRRGTAGAGARTNQLSSTDDGIPIQRSSRTSSELELPAATSDPIFSRGRRAVERRGDPSGGDASDDDSETRAARRSRSADSDSSAVPETRPAYKVRPNDTLRSIARDTLGSARRADEILDLNRDIIDDPQNLIVGQMLELPEDARTSIRRRVSR